jgi:hypothetical protein
MRVHAWLVSLLNEPDDAVLLELGRLTWAVINLEDVIPEIRRAIGPAPGRLARAPISAWIKDALNVLNGWPESEVRETACRWFNIAHQALEERNRVLHSVPATLITIADDGAVKTHGQVLDYLPRRQGESFSRISLAEDELRLVRQNLADAREGWIEICLALVEESKRNAGD